MWQALLAALPAIAEAAPQLAGAAGGATGGAAGGSAMNAGGLSLMGSGANSPMSLGSGSASSSGLGSLGAGMAPELGGAPSAPNALSGLGAPPAQGGLMDMNSLMATTGGGGTGSEKGKKYQNALVDKYVQQGLQAPDMSQPTDFMSLMNMLGGRR